MTTLLLNGMIYALTYEFSKQSFSITISKILSIIDSLLSIGATTGNIVGSSKTQKESCKSDKNDNLDIVNKKIKELYIKARLETVNGIIKECPKSNVVNISCTRLQLTIEKIQRELELIKLLPEKHKKGWFSTFY